MRCMDNPRAWLEKVGIGSEILVLMRRPINFRASTTNLSPSITLTLLSSFRSQQGRCPNGTTRNTVRTQVAYFSRLRRECRSSSLSRVGDHASALTNPGAPLDKAYHFLRAAVYPGVEALHQKITTSRLEKSLGTRLFTMSGLEESPTTRTLPVECLDLPSFPGPGPRPTMSARPVPVNEVLDFATFTREKASMCSCISGR
mmetsp:Transcript_867/g.1973  ORF Transcript_867/g.1973 Transcript_867/m.1973 type:complete len:201 (+) Transcript_867:1351-1953(+)